MDNGCIFCKISGNEIDAKKIYENDNFFSIPDANPITEGHSLVISKAHYETTLDVPSTLGPELMDCVKQTALNVMKDTESNGFNIVNNNKKSAGQVVFHAHYHIIPRKEGDGLKVVG